MAENTKKIDIAIALVFVAAGAVIVFNFIKQNAGRTSAEEEGSAPPSTEQSVEAADESLDVLDGLKDVELVKDFESWTPEAKVDDQKSRQLKLKIEGAVESGYVYVKASSAGKPLTRWDSLYFKMNDLGGHLFRPQSLPAPADGETVLLYSLSDVAYLSSVPYDESRTPEHADWLSLIQGKKSLFPTIFISSLNPSLIEEARLYYACADGSDCSIAVVE